ncbi:uncharacterized protein PgNI_03081 [Pyricularia grisea]|uniref:RRM domain-containing protein n=1 Tax=Pyricularia grisea TaxID=148305 RepID=A0A6P8BBC6_PYRGI|nr:uncharacterized protein PgNI_03081 [Pyricularia grisea]TLD13141.1 hypothetical protein PgNI_03081 [Pyricularia grisea]
MDRSLDEILAERQTKNGGRGSRGPRNGGGSGGGNRRRERERQDYPRDGVRKSYRDDQSRNLDSEWVHDRYDDNDTRRGGRYSRRRDDDLDKDQGSSRGTKIRVENIHYELTEEDLQGLFSRIGPIISLELLYDRSGRSEGVAYVTYESHKDATLAVKEFDGANAAGQPIRLSIIPAGAGSRRNPFDNAVKPGRPLSERITMPSGRNRSLSPEEDAARRGIDRYIPSGSRSGSPYTSGNRRDGRRPGARRERGGGGGGRRRGEGDEEGGQRTGRDGRTKKTQEELDAEMDDYFGGGGGGGNNNATTTPAAAATTAAPATATVDDDIDMIA